MAIEATQTPCPDLCAEDFERMAECEANPRETHPLMKEAAELYARRLSRMAASFEDD